MGFLDSLAKLRETWDLRSIILLSLLLQTILILTAPMRKRVSKGLVIMPIWVAYLLADWAANFAVGLINKSRRKTSGHVDNDDLLVFWAPFLLAHLGGPDTITAFALEDNQLWLRHLLQLLFQCGTTAYVFVVSLYKKNLWMPTMFVLLAGIIKYSERTRALYLASSEKFRDSTLKDPDPGPNYAKLMDEYFSKKEAKLPTRIDLIPEPHRAIRADNAINKHKLSHKEVVRHAYRFFNTFKGLIVDLIFSFRERNQSRDFFLERTEEDAFKLVEVELNFIYEVLYTKAVVVRSRPGYILRLISFILVVAALVRFHLLDRKKFDPIDVRISFVLLYGAIALDIIALVMLIFSDWTTVALEKPADEKSADDNSNHKTKDNTTAEGSSQSRPCCLRRRWSESVTRYNLIYYCLHQRSKWTEKLWGYLGVLNFLDGLKYEDTEEFTKDLRKFIFEELRAKSVMAEDLETAKEICSSRGDWVLRVERCVTLLTYVNDVDYDESLLLWHIATELCYNDDKRDSDEGTDLSKDKNKDRYFSKLLSDYMLYLLIRQPQMMSAVAGIGQIRFRDTCAEAKKFFRGRKLGKGQEQTQASQGIHSVKNCFRGVKIDKGEEQKQASQNVTPAVKLQRQACESILRVNTEVRPVHVKGDRSKSVLFEACRLAKELKELGKEEKWKIMSKVWVELLSYAACHCRATSHAQRLSKGGELITVVWLLMFHFGLGDQFQINEGHARAKLIVGK